MVSPGPDLRHPCNIIVPLCSKCIVSLILYYLTNGAKQGALSRNELAAPKIILEIHYTAE